MGYFLCQWHSHPRSVPTVQAPVPHLVDDFDGLGHASILFFGGQSSATYAEVWRTTRPLINTEVEVDLAELAINITLIDTSGRTPNDIGLLWDVNLTANELNDGEGFYQRGLPYTQSSASFNPARSSIIASTFHSQTMAFATQANESIWFVPLPALSTSNSSRPKFNFPLARHSHASSQEIAYYARHPGKPPSNRF